VANSYEVGQLVKGTVTQLANFGAFARIEDGIEGLIHVSELAEERIQHPKQVVEEGEELILRIIRIDPQRRRMGLSLRRALDTPDSELVSVFGENVLAERDELARKVRARLEAEGLTAPVAPEVQIAAGESPTTLSEIDEKAAGEAQVAAFEERRRRAEEAERARQRRQEERREQQRASSSSDFGDENMSAMAMAFAMAGADDISKIIAQAEDGSEDSASSADDTPADEAPALAEDTTAQQLAGDTEVDLVVPEGEHITDAGPEERKVLASDDTGDEAAVESNPELEETENPQPGEQGDDQE
jgi:predicted RNA-binding protein with RPS1 domain